MIINILFIFFLLGSGVNKDNLLSILNHTGATEFHGSASVKKKSRMININTNLSLGSNSDEYTIKVTSLELVKLMCGLYQDNLNR